MTLTEQDIRDRTQAVLDEVGTEAEEVPFRSALWDAGLAFVQYPEGKGGLGVSPSLQGEVEATIRDSGRFFHPLATNTIGIGMGLPTVLTYGSEEHHEKHLKRIFTGEDWWCQMFSEPSHGSDVAGLSSRAERDGDEWVVNGQKVWTSVAHMSRYGMLLVRTDPDAPKHKGLSYFILDMQSPGVEIRPLYQITGDAEFNEVFFTDVRIPHTNLLGDVGDGWRVATTTLMNERVALGGSTQPRGSGTIATLVDLWEKEGATMPPAEQAIMRDRVAQLWIEAEVGRLTTLRARANSTIGNPGPEGSVGKLASAELNQRIWNAVTDLQGPSGMMHEIGYPRSRNEGLGGFGSLSKSFLRSQANTIEGGTSDIMRNILGERVLCLPGEPRVDKTVPWKDIPT
ncbi:MAG: acyl-CoA dehydrogenase family protein [Acidimicrobiales bacterium]|jgi:alkylation response protein AidB-like acyl-CoA dehydrogenase|nr:acyl-CoA dehydrogenase family protein [Acidimicrobiales bacterium]